MESIESPRCVLYPMKRVHFALNQRSELTFYFLGLTSISKRIIDAIVSLNSQINSVQNFVTN
jgi:hypothetical protein